MERTFTPFAGYLFLVINAVVLLLIGYLARKYAVRDYEDFVVAGRRAKWPLVAGSMVITWTWGSTILLACEGGYVFGWPALWTYQISMIALLMLTPLWVKIKRLIPAGTTFPEWVRYRFGNEVHLVVTLLTLFLFFLLIVYLAVGFGTALQPVFGIPYSVGMIFSVLIVIIYSFWGGFWSSLIADNVQYIVTIICVTASVVFGIGLVGGLDGLFDSFKSMGVQKGYAFMTPDAFFGFFLIMLLGWLWQGLSDQTVWQRVYSVDTVKDAKKMVIMAGITVLFTPFVSGLVGLVVLQKGIDLKVGTDAFPVFISTYAPAWLMIAFAIMIFNAIASTLNSMLVGFSAMFTTDIYSRFVKTDLSETRKLTINRIAVVVIGVLAIGFAIEQKSLLSLAIYLSGFILTLSIPLITAFVMPNINPRGVLVSLITLFILGISLSSAVNFGWLTQIGSFNVKTWHVYLLMNIVGFFIPIVWSLFSPGQRITFRELGEMIKAKAA